MSLWEGNLDRQGFFKTPGSMELVERSINGDPIHTRYIHISYSESNLVT